VEQFQTTVRRRTVCSIRIPIPTSCIDDIECAGFNNVRVDIHRINFNGRIVVVIAIAIAVVVRVVVVYFRDVIVRDKAVDR